MGNTATRYLMSLFSTDFFYSEKRKRDDNDTDDECDQGRYKRRKLHGISAPKYIYKELFEQGVYSDIRIIACNKEWNLHRVHLKQCPYFASMLSGAWKEANQDEISIEIIDPNITVQALDAVFGSLYLDEIELDKKNIIPVLAAASHFRMDKLAERCGDIMIENINHNVFLKYYHIAEQYGLKKLREATFDYILMNIITNSQLWHIYPEISIELMTELLSHPNLVVQHSEQNVYMVVLKWLYRCIVQIREKKRTDAEIVLFFSTLGGSEYLLKDEGVKYQPAFMALNLQAILITHVSVRLLLQNNVIPHAWINSAVMANYCDYLRANEGMDEGPTEEDISDLDKRGIRLGRYLKNFGTWRMVGLHCGLVLSWSLSHNLLEVTRMRGGSTPDLVSNIPSRRVLCKVSFIRHGRARLTTPPQVLNLDLGQKIEVFRLPEPFQMPMMIQIRLLLTSTENPQQEYSPMLIQ